MILGITFNVFATRGVLQRENVERGILADRVLERLSNINETIPCDAEALFARIKGTIASAQEVKRRLLQTKKDDCAEGVLRQINALKDLQKSFQNEGEVEQLVDRLHLLQGTVASYRQMLLKRNRHSSQTSSSTSEEQPDVQYLGEYHPNYPQTLNGTPNKKPRNEQVPMEIENLNAQPSFGWFQADAQQNPPVPQSFYNSPLVRQANVQQNPSVSCSYEPSVPDNPEYEVLKYQEIVAQCLARLGKDANHLTMEETKRINSTALCAILFYEDLDHFIDEDLEDAGLIARYILLNDGKDIGNFTDYEKEDAELMARYLALRS